ARTSSGRSGVGALTGHLLGNEGGRFDASYHHLEGRGCGIASYVMSDEELQQGPIHAVHVELGATFAPFGGWEMPVSYAGTVAEHKAVRETVGLFDVSHLGKARVTGSGAAEFVNSTLTNDLGRIGPGRAQYTLCCTDSGGVLDD